MFFIDGLYLGFRTGTSFGNVQLDEEYFGQNTENHFFHQRRHSSPTHSSVLHQVNRFLPKYVLNIILNKNLHIYCRQIGFALNSALDLWEMLPVVNVERHYRQAGGERDETDGHTVI